jgi:hypothetical protein
MSAPNSTFSSPADAETGFSVIIDPSSARISRATGRLAVPACLLFDTGDETQVEADIPPALLAEMTRVWLGATLALRRGLASNHSATAQWSHDPLFAGLPVWQVIGTFQVSERGERRLAVRSVTGLEIVTDDPHRRSVAEYVLDIGKDLRAAV